MKTVRDFNFKGKRVLMRCDFNIPLSEKGEILDDFKIQQTIPTINYLLSKGAKIILMSHLGRPEGKVVEGLRLTPIQDRLMEYLDVSIAKAPDCVGAEIEKWAKKMQPGEILLLENLRFHQEEKNNDEGFARNLAKLGDIYINDAFGNSHRSHASMVGIPGFLPSGIGFLVEKELNVLADLMKSPEKPLIAVIGGVKVETKVGLIDKISAVADFVLIGGLVNKAIIDQKVQFKYPKKIIAPVDEIDGGKDIGFETRKLFAAKIMSAKTCFFNGTLGKTEEEKYTYGTKDVLRAIIKSGAFSIVGGGETVELINKLNWTKEFGHVSTGGGAMLTFLSGEKLPGIEALK